MKIQSSHLNLRFYERDGWSIATVSIYVDGDFVRKGILHSKLDPAYYVPDVSSKIRTDKVIEHGHTVVDYKGNHLTNSEEIRQYIKEVCG